ncbi:MAG: lytic transglycosylase domain-containing protein [Thermoanaerobaculia bacterium]|nr:lytic transglycosylase domain-containing protein [Thermoanaerobaculia bacterium]
MATTRILFSALLLVAPAVAAADPDPRIELAQLQLAERWQTALDRTEEILQQDPALGERLWLPYLRADLLERLGRLEEANSRFARLLAAEPELAQFARLRMAELQERMGHPEVAAGLVATLLGRGAPREIESDASELLARTLAAGGDCRLLGRMDSWQLESADRRTLRLAAAECALRHDEVERATELLVDLLLEATNDLVARQAADRLAARPSHERLPAEARIAVGLAFHHNREFDRAIAHLEAGLGRLDPERLTFDAERLAEYRYAAARARFWLGEYDLAAAMFRRLAEAGGPADTVARALYQQARCHELAGDWAEAAAAFRRAYGADPTGDWAAAALFSGLRLEFRRGREDAAAELLASLDSRFTWRAVARRAALFLASSDIVRGRADRAAVWLRRSSGDDTEEFLYWRGRLAELAGDGSAAVRLYAELLVRDAYDPLAEAARERLARPELAPLAEATAQQLAAIGTVQGLYGAWLLVGDDSALGQRARDRLRRELLGDRRARPFLELRTVAPPQWPLWRAVLVRPSERFLALGQWELGRAAISEYFPWNDPRLALTASTVLAQRDLPRRSLYIAEVLAQRVPSYLPPALLPNPFRVILYPYPYRALIVGEAEARGIDRHLLASVIREESRFDAGAVSVVSARGLTQFVYPTARQVAGDLGVRLDDPTALHDPALSIRLGAAYLAELTERFDGRQEAAVTAYNAGPDQARLWTSYCYGREPAEYLSKVGFEETRRYLDKVLTSRSHYRQLYGVPRPEESTTGGSSSRSRSR